MENGDIIIRLKEVLFDFSEAQCVANVINNNMIKFHEYFSEIAKEYDYRGDMDKELNSVRKELEDLYINFIKEVFNNNHYNPGFKRMERMNFEIKLRDFFWDKQSKFEIKAMREETPLHVSQRQVLAIDKVEERIKEADIHNVEALNKITKQLKMLRYNVHELKPRKNWYD